MIQIYKKIILARLNKQISQCIKFKSCFEWDLIKRVEIAFKGVLKFFFGDKFETL